ncbi:type II toxin-antitoxin system Phd/YefM family antitoxin [Sphingomonas sp.]|uniref:type II toxin-antitoxin system Phd/YefM family antitoxin n=1 Tax=Sphingomonas sp. TaxID=28214 RepID=UPI003B00E679
MRHVPIAEFKDKLSEIVAAAEAGEDIVITRHGRDVVRLSGVEADRREQRRAALEGLVQFRDDLRGEGVRVTSDEWIAWKEEGRR